MMQPKDIVLPATYYLTNFGKLIAHAQTHYPDLLSECESRWLSDFQTLTADSQCLLVRLLTRKGCWFRSDKLAYSEIDDIPGALQQLQSAGFLQLNPKVKQAEVARLLLTKAEMTRYWPFLAKQRKKEALLSELEQCTSLENISWPFDVIVVTNDSILNVFSTLFFANGYQDFSQFVLEDLGINQFESYPLGSNNRFFRSREDLEHLIKINTINSELDDYDLKDMSTLNTLVANLPNASSHQYIERRRARLINTLARSYERLDNYDKAIELFSLSKLAPSRERRARMFEKQNKDDLAWAMVNDMLEAPQDVAEYEVAHNLQRRLRRKKGERIARTSFCCPERHLCLDLSQQRVEHAVLEHFHSQGWSTFYLENHFLNTLFGLTFWDIIFAPVTGAFINGYQSHPLDLFHSSFYSLRKEMIDERLKEVELDGISRFMERSESKFGLSNAFVYWPALSPEWLLLAQKHFDGPLLCALFKVMLRDLKLFRSGMPDLIAFKDDQVLWCEVKGPGDKLQDNQKRWMSEFSRLGIHYETCYVTDACNRPE